MYKSSHSQLFRLCGGIGGKAGRRTGVVTTYLNRPNRSGRCCGIGLRENVKPSGVCFCIFTLCIICRPTGSTSSVSSVNRPEEFRSVARHVLSVDGFILCVCATLPWFFYVPQTPGTLLYPSCILFMSPESIDFVA